MKKIFILLFSLIALSGYSQNTDITRKIVNAKEELNVRDSTIMEVISANSEDSLEVDTAIKTQIAEYEEGDTLAGDTVGFAYVAGTSLDTVFGGITVNGTSNLNGNIVQNLNGGYNISLGLNASQDLDPAASANIAFGVESLANTTTGSYNYAFGGQSLYSNTTGSYNIGIGLYSGYNSNNLSNRLFISSLQHNNLGADTTESIIYGLQNANPSLQQLYFNSNVRIRYTSYFSNKLNLAQISATTTDGDHLYETGQDKLYGFTNGIAGWYDKAIFSQYAAVTHTGVVSAVSLIDNTNKVGTTTLPANFFKQGKALRYRIVGYYTTDAAPGNATITINIGGTTFRTTGSFGLDASVTNGFWQIEGAITCYTTGVTGTLAGMVMWQHVQTAGADQPFHNEPMTTVTPVTFNTTASGQFDVLWTADDAGTSITTTTVRLWEIF